MAGLAGSRRTLLSRRILRRIAIRMGLEPSTLGLGASHRQHVPLVTHLVAGRTMVEGGALALNDHLALRRISLA